MHDNHGMALDAAHAAFDVAFNRRESATLVERTTDGLRAALRAFLANAEISPEMVKAAIDADDERTGAETCKHLFRAMSAKLADELGNKGE